MDLKSDRKLLTFIVPAYNTGNLLEKCIQSILCQTYENFECIIVNDGSTDNTGEVCDKLGKSDARIRIISKENEGLSVARNIAVKEAKGYYLMFVDSDDALVPQNAMVMIDTLEKTGADAAMCKYFSNDESPKPVSVPVSYEVKDAHEFCDKVLRDEIGSQLWQFMFKKEQWDDIVSPPGRYAQDMAVLHMVIDKMKTVVMLDEYLYYYFVSRTDNTSNTKSHKTKGKFDRAYAFWKRVEFAKDNGYPDAVEDVLTKAVAFSVMALSKKDALDEKYADDIKMIQHGIRENKKSISASAKLDSKKKAASTAIMYAPRLYVHIRTLLH